MVRMLLFVGGSDMSKRSVAAVCREMVMVKSVVSDEAVKAKLLADLSAELAELSGVRSTQMALPLPAENAATAEKPRK